MFPEIPGYFERDAKINAWLKLLIISNRVGMILRVQGVKGSRVQGSGFRVQGSGFRVQGSGFKVQGSGFKVDESQSPNLKRVI
jgi:hypothetical protein